MDLKNSQTAGLSAKAADRWRERKSIALKKGQEAAGVDAPLVVRGGVERSVRSATKRRCPQRRASFTLRQR